MGVKIISVLLKEEFTPLSHFLILSDSLSSKVYTSQELPSHNKASTLTSQKYDFPPKEAQQMKV